MTLALSASAARSKRLIGHSDQEYQPQSSGRQKQPYTSRCVAPGFSRVGNGHAQALRAMHGISLKQPGATFP